jgi:lysozyme
MTAHSQLHEALPRRRDDAVGKLLRRMTDRNRRQRDLAGRRVSSKTREQLHRHMNQRKAALAFSAGVMGLSGAAMGSPTTAPVSIAGSVQLAKPLVRLPASHLHASDSFKQALVQEEGVRDTVYRDVGGFPTVGVGHLVEPGDGLKVGDRVNYDRILDFLDGDLREAEAAVVRLVGDLPLFQHEFDALVDLVYNVGEGNVSPRKSPRLNTAIAAHDYEAIAAELDYRFCAGQMARGLAYRSERRARIFSQASYDDTRPAAAVRREV